MNSLALVQKISQKMLSLILVVALLVTCIPLSVHAAETPYEVTKSGGALIRTSYAESAASVRRAAYGSILWVKGSKTNSSGNLWYQLTDGYWIYSGNVKAHSCTWTQTGSQSPTCTAVGYKYYQCNKCYKTKTTQVSANGHKYSGNVCTVCGAWNTSSLKSQSSVNNVKYYVTTTAKVHSGPYGACSTVTTLSKGTEITVTQKVVNASNNTWYKYSGGYIFSDYVVKHSSCSWNSGTVTKKATCTATGSKSYSCTICGKSKTETIAKVSHKYTDNVCTVCGTWNTSSLKSQSSVNNVKYYVTTTAKVHSGPYGACSTVTTLSKGTEITVTQKVVNASNNTWYKYSGGYIFSDYVVKHSSCSWNSGSVTKKATCTATGTKTYKCTICGKSKTETIAKVSHKYTDNVCTVCNAWNTSSLKSQSSVNNVKYYVTKTAKVHSGPYGDCKTVATLSKGTEIVVTEKVVNASKNTWYKYSGGYIFEDYVVKHSSCSWDKGTVTKKATCTATGSKSYKCTICGKSKTETIAKVSHKYTDNVCTVCGAWNTSSLKSQSSVNNVKYYVTKTAKVHAGPYGDCKTVKTLSKGTEIVVTEKVVNASKNTWYKYSGGYIYADYVVKHSSCSWGKGTVTKKATCTAAGSKTYKCTVCGKSKTETIAATGHKYKNGVCTACSVWDTASLKSKTAVSNVKYYVTKTAKVHAGPYGDCKTVKTLSKGTEIVVTQKVVNASDNVWYKYSGGYIYEDYMVKHSSCSWNKGTVTKKATCSATGVKTHKCTVCGKSKTATISKTGHAYKSGVCTMCNVWDTASLKSKTAVSNVKYYVTKTAKVHAGPYGNCKTVKTLSKGTEIVITQKVVNASGNVWYKYSGGYVFEDYLAKHSSCSWNKGTVTKKATCTATGVKTHKCTVCGKSKTTTVEKAAHKYKSNVCTVCGTWNTASLKSKTTMNNVKYYVTKTAKVHSGPYGNCKTVKSLAKGTTITVTQKVVNASGSTWYKYSGGYVYEDYVMDYALYTAKTTLNTTSLTLYVGQTKTIKATVKGPSSTVTWKSSDTAVATVSAKGAITAKKTGTCTITAKANGKSATCKITVKQLAAPKSVVLTTQAGRKFKVSHSAVSGASGYEINYVGGLERSYKDYTSTSTTVTVAMGTGCNYTCTVRAYKTIDGKKYYSKNSTSVKVHVHNAKEDIPAKTSTSYTAADYTYHTVKVDAAFFCVGCKGSINYTTSSKKKHTFTCGVCQTCGKKQASDYVVGKIYPGVGSGPLYSSAEASKGKNPVSVAAKYSDSFFTGSSQKFNSDLCKLSAVGAAASYKKAYGEEFLAQCGFDKPKGYNSSSQTSTDKAGKNDHARYIIGHKKIAGTDKILVAVLINGYTSGNYEWISNFNVGKSGLHAGFSQAAEEVTAKINAYIKSKNINTSKVKIWVTGHSRAGAVTGMTAVNLNAKYGIENVFAYGFATPNGVPTDMAKKVNTKNIFNIINPGDFVPYVVPESWGFTKYGTTKVLSVNDTVKKLYKTMTQDSYNGLTVSKRESLIQNFCKLASGRDEYYTTKTGYYSITTEMETITVKVTAKPSDFGRAIGLLMSKAGANAECLGLVNDCLLCCGGAVSVLWEMLCDNGIAKSKPITEAHCMETYVAMVYAAYP